MADLKDAFDAARDQVCVDASQIVECSRTECEMVDHHERRVDHADTAHHSDLVVGAWVLAQEEQFGVRTR